MNRREFMQAALLAAVTAGCVRSSTEIEEPKPEPTAGIPRRPYKDGVKLSVVGLGGMVVAGLEQEEANRLVAESVERGVNYFEAAPTYGDAELRLGPALEPYRDNVFLVCKTTQRDAVGAQRELDQSLTRLRTDHLDLYQFHAVSTMEDVEKILAPGGAGEVFLKAREEGKVRFLGLSAHAEEPAIALMDRFECDSILFPVNFICYAQGNFGPRLMQHAKEKGVARLALKALAHGPWREGETRSYHKCWYRPVSDPALARQALRFTLSEDVTALIPPGDEGLYRMALGLASDLPPLSAAERRELLAGTEGLEPIFRTK